METSMSIKVPKERASRETLPIFLNCCEELSAMVSAYNIKIESYNTNGVEKFLSLSADKQIEILTVMKTYSSQLMEASASKIDLIGDNRKYAWFSMRSMGLLPPDDLFDKINEKDMIEVYDAGSIQIFRSLELYRYMSYSFSEIFCFTWMDLFTRDSFVFKRISETLSQILSGEINGVYTPNFPVHYAEEIFSNKKIWIKMQSALMCRLYRVDGSVGGFLHTFKIPEHGSLKT